MIEANAWDKLVTSQITWQIAPIAVRIPAPDLILAGSVYFGFKLRRIVPFPNNRMLEQFHYFIFG